MNNPKEVPVDPSRPQQSPFTEGDQDTGLPALEHGDPLIPTQEEREIGKAALASICQQIEKKRNNNNVSVRGPGR